MDVRRAALVVIKGDKEFPEIRSGSGECLVGDAIYAAIFFPTEERSASAGVDRLGAAIGLDAGAK